MADAKNYLRSGAALLTGGLSETIFGADDAKAGLDDATMKTRSLGNRMSGFYGAQGRGTNAFFDPLAAQAGKAQPDYLQKLYSAPGSDPGQSGAAYGSAKQTLGGGGNLKADYYAPGGMNSQLSHAGAGADAYATARPQQEGPGYLEQFYQSSANGTNPYYDRLRDVTSKAMERRSAAGGSYNAGESMRQQGEALSNLSAQEYAGRAKMAGEADAAKNTRLTSLTSEATNVDTNALARNQARINAAGQIDTGQVSSTGALTTAAKNASDEGWKGKDYVKDLATGSSDELGKGMDRQTKALFDTAVGRTGIAESYDALQGKAMSDAEVSAIALELERSGVDSKVIAAWMAQATKTAEGVAKVAGGAG